MRQPKPFLRKQTKTWYVQIGKRQINLGPDKERAWAKYHRTNKWGQVQLLTCGV